MQVGFFVTLPFLIYHSLPLYIDSSILGWFHRSLMGLSPPQCLLTRDPGYVEVDHLEGLRYTVLGFTCSHFITVLVSLLLTFCISCTGTIRHFTSVP